MRTLLPFRDNWSLYPSVYLLNNDPGLSLTTLGQDTLQVHTWQLTVGATLRAHRPNVAVNYVNNRFLPTYGLSLSQQTTPYRTSLGFAFQTGRQLSLSMVWPFERRHQVALSYTFEHRHNDALLSQLLAGGRYGQLRLSYSFAFGRQFTYSISPEIGRILSVAGAWYSRALGGQRDQVVLAADARAYVKNPLWANHVLALRLRGSYAFGHDNTQNYFLYGTQGASVLSVQSSNLMPLRGFTPRSEAGAPNPGAAVVAGYAEYRFPVWHVQRGLFSWPIYFEHVHLALFADAGNTFGAQFVAGRRSDNLAFAQAMRQLWVAFGGEVRLDFVLGWQVPITVRAGAAQPAVAGGSRVVDKVRPHVYFDVGTLL